VLTLGEVAGNPMMRNERSTAMNIRVLTLWILCGVACECCAADAVLLTVDTRSPQHAISPRLYGVFFEDINFAGDGGLNAELVKNGSFEFPEPLMGWSIVEGTNADNDLAVVDDKPAFSSNPHFLRIHSATGGSGAANEGFRGIGVRAGETYEFSVQARSPNRENATLRLALVDEDGKILAEARVGDIDGEWSEHSARLTPNATTAKSRLVLTSANGGTVDLDMVSLCPQKTWKGRPHGLRADLVQRLADLRPAFLRFPGGCIVEGSELSRRYQWKTTIGDRPDRHLIINRWNYEFAHRRTPDYFQSFGLGFYEYFLLAEDIGAEPLPILNCGMACQFNTGELAPLEALDTYIQDALDLIEFANGPATTTWGAKRAAMGHPEPFGMKLLGVGNEQWGPQYFERYEAFAKVLKEKHPEIELISGSGPFPAGENFDFAWKRLRELNADIVDEHCYAMADWFLRSATRYDDYDRSGPKVFMGEYAVQSVDIVSPDNRNNLRGALAEAAFMTGLERNSDVVVMSSYAPLLGHEEAWQWRPNLIWFDNLESYATPNYYVQQLFAQNRGDVVLPVKVDDPRPPKPAAGRVGFATTQASAEYDDARVTQDGKTVRIVDLFQEDPKLTKFWGKWEVEGETIRQTDPGATARVHFGDFAGRDYTVSMRARKVGGRGGFGVIVRNSPGGSFLQWDVGGESGHQFALKANLASHSEDDTAIASKPGKIEVNRWYDVKVELNGSRVRCYLDGELVHDLDVVPPGLSRLFAAASRDESTGQVVLKVVNTSEERIDANLNLLGATNVGSRANVIMLHGNPDDENSLEQPERIKPLHEEVDIAGPRFRYEFFPNSLTILQIGTSGS
jgi:alpha-N-arabinofuranosidase